METQQTIDFDALDRKLLNAVTEYDRKQSAKKFYNRYALALYCGAVSEAITQMKGGKSVRQAIINCFNGRLMDVCLKAVGEKTGTIEEHRSPRY